MEHHSVGVGAETGAPVVRALRALGLGDALTGIPALRGLRRAYPDHRLLIACGPELGRWFTDLQLFDGAVPTHELDPIADPPQPDVAVDLHGCGQRSHQVLRMTNPGRLFGFGCTPPDFIAGPIWDKTAHEVDRWCDLVRWIGGACDPSDLRLGPPGRSSGTGPVVIHPGAAFPSRRWPVPRWRRLVQELSGRHQVVVTGGPAEQARCADVCRGTTAITRAGRTPLPELAALVAGSSLVVSGDTGIAHLATAFGIPSVTLFGPVSPALWGPAIDQDIHRCLWHGSGATVPGDPHGESLDPRLAAITVSEVLSAVADLMAVTTPSAAPAAHPRTR
jgi:hypothetical protein